MFFVDVQGTLIDDEKRMPIDGAIEFIDFLNERKIPYVVITNNTKHASAEFLAYLNGIGLHIGPKNYLDPLMVLLKVVKEKEIAAYGSREFLGVLEEMGYILDYKAPKAVLIGIKQDFTNDEYADMIGFLLDGASLVGMHATTLYAKEKKRYPGVGAILAMLAFATGRSAKVVGKPSKEFYAQALLKLSELSGRACDPRGVTIISDDVKGDLVGAQEMGMKSIFVLSGKYKRAEEILPYLKESEKPHAVAESIKEVLESLKRDM